MAQPPRYDRRKDFTEDYGDNTDHAALNAELDGVSQSVNKTRDNLALIQRDDGALANGIVTADSLAVGLKDEIIEVVGVGIDDRVQEAQAAAAEAVDAAVLSGESATASGVFAGQSAASAGNAQAGAQAADGSRIAAQAAAASINPQFLSSDYAGTDGPPVIWAYMTWADTATLTRKRRNAANSAWIIEGRLFRNHLPIIPLDEIPTTDIGQISVETVGIMEWGGEDYAPVAIAAANTTYDNAESGLEADDVQAALDELGARADFAIIYPNGGTEAAPASVAINMAYVVAHPFPGHHVIARAEVLFAGKWSDTGWAYRAGGIGVRASEYDGAISVVTGETGLLYARNTTGTPHNTAAANYVTPLPCRVLVWKLKGAI